MLHTTIEDRVTGKPLFLPGARLEVERLRWQAQGGPLDGVIAVQGAADSPGALAQLLRCPVMVADPSGGPCWWGFVEAVEVPLQTGLAVIDLAEMSNRVAVHYRDEAPGPGVSGWQWRTAWAEDAASVARYGRKERVLSLAEARPGEAEALRDATLARVGWPRWKVEQRINRRDAESAENTQRIRKGGEAREDRARLRVKGWWHSLDWVYYARAEGWQGALGGGAVQAVGIPTAARVAQPWVANGAWPLKDIWIKAARMGNPTDELVVELLAQVTPSVVVLATCAGLPASALTGELSWTKFTLPTEYMLSASGTYWLGARRSGAADAANYYRVTVDEGLGSGTFSLWNGSAWVARAPDAGLIYSLTGEEETSEQLRTLFTQAGQFLNGCRVKDASGVKGRQYRAGGRRASAEAAELLAMGAAGGVGLLGRVTAERAALIEKMADPGSADWVLDGAGRLRWREGRLVMLGEGVVGRWARLEGMESAAGLVWVDSAEWTPEQGLRVGWV